MYLKALEIQGFKSFPDKTRLTFEKKITAIVGPNGSGKSNIADAILWVLGEQSTKTLRGGKMEDVIFGGTEKRNPMGFAEVSLIIDNSARVLDIDNTEVMITRRYYRSGESEYYLNREPVRLKDITELLMDTGLGRDGYSIIGQGKISEIISAKGTDRREIFEEAAGISKFRYRKEEAERKLQRTDENLLRINDKIEELELQVGPLKEQAETARRYLLLRDELRALEVSVCMESLDKLQAQAAIVNSDYETAKANLDAAHRELEELYALSESISEKMREKDMEAEAARSHLSRTEAEAAECESSIAVLQTNIRNNQESLQRMHQELAEQENRARSLEAQIDEQRKRIEEIDSAKAGLDREIDAVLSRAAENAAETNEAERQLSGLMARENSLSGSLTQSRTMLGMMRDSLRELEERAAAMRSETEAELERQRDARSRLAEDQEKAGAAEERVIELNNVISGYRLRTEGREKKVRALSERFSKLTIEEKALDSRISMLSEMEKEYEGFSKAVKTVMREAKRGVLRGIHGPVAKLVKTDDRYTLAIETALGGAMQNIVVDTQEDGKAAIELLKRQDAGRATFLPISTIKGHTLEKLPKDEQGYLGTALELARYDEKYSGVFANLLGRTIVIETLGDAVRISKKYNNQYRIVTLDGQMINPGGSMTGGSASHNAGILSRANELKKLREQREKLGIEAEKCRAELSDAQRELDRTKYELQVAETELAAAQEEAVKCRSAVSQSRLLLESIEKKIETLEAERQSAESRIKDSRGRVAVLEGEIQRIEAELSELRKEIEEKSKGQEEFDRRRREISDRLSELRAARSSLEAEREAVSRSISQLERLKQDIFGDSDYRQQCIEALEKTNAQLERELEEKKNRLTELRKKTEEIKSAISQITNTRLELEGRRAQADKTCQEKNRGLLDLERLCAKLEQKKLAADMEEKQILDKLWDSYGLSRSAAQAVRQPVESMSKAGRRISELKKEISSLGNPNLGAIEEYERVSSRYNFLIEQRDDVEKSKKELQKIISSITAEMEEIFVREFKAIDQCFRQTFLELFGGGKAALVLEDEENVLECGIEIKVQPPGKALSTISLLSGGEMAFVAIALYFAILKVRPTPFCVMDEIEAALDEANVIRFAEYMRSMSDKTQFIVITHRRGTMERADMLYGVTMQEKGVSKIISVDLEEAEKNSA